MATQLVIFLLENTQMLRVVSEYRVSSIGGVDEWVAFGSVEKEGKHVGSR